MAEDLRAIINGSAEEMVEYIRASKIDIDVNLLEELGGQVRGANSPKRDEFLAEAKRVRQLLRERS